MTNINNDYSLFWTETIHQLLKDDSLSEQEYAMWFQNMKYINGSSSFLTLGVPSKFYRDQVIQRYKEILESKLCALTGSEMTLVFEITDNDPNTEKKSTEHKPTEKSDPSVSPSAGTTAKRRQHSQLKPNYTFDQFVVGSNNKLAANAAQAISSNPGGHYNPFLIYGGVGLGKTHLMQAIGNEIHSSAQDKKVLYIAAESFINEFITAIRGGAQNKFKSKYRKIDLLLIDDIHDLQKAKETQEELFHTFNALYDSGKQLVFTCDRPPAELRNFTDRLKSRFNRGLSVDIQPPDFETRYAILEKKLESLSVPVSGEVLELIAHQVVSNVRDLESALTKMTAYAELIGKEVTVEMVNKHLKETFSGNAPMNVDMDRIQRIVADYFNVTPADLKGKKRTKQVTLPRHIAMFIIREMTDYSTTEIGLEFGGRDHSTVMHACQKIEDRMKIDPTLQPTISELKRSINESL